MSNFERLKAHIISLSVSDQFQNAKDEWVISGFEYHEGWDECPCGKDIKEKCFIKNQLNKNETYVGNVCINKFIEIDTGNLFAGLKRIIEDDTKNPNEDLIVHAYNSGYLFGETEYNFLMRTKNKRNLSLKQLAWKQKINRRIVNQTVVRKVGNQNDPRN